MSKYRTLTNRELLHFAQHDPRYQQDPLFTELAVRLASMPVRYDEEIRATPELIDVR